MSYMRSHREIFVHAVYSRAAMQSTATAFAVLVALLCGWQAAQAAIVFDGASSVSANSNIVTMQHTTGPGLDRAGVGPIPRFSGDQTAGADGQRPGQIAGVDKSRYA